MRKCLTCLFAATAVSAYAANSTIDSNRYQAFQEYDNEYNAGFGVTSGNLTNGSTGGVNNTQYVNLEIEHLFNMGVWFDVNANLLTYYSQAIDPATPAVAQTTGSQPNFGGLNINVGYAFPLVKDTLMLTPYGTVGRNTNISSYILANQPTNINLTNDYFWSVGAGARLEYRINSTFDFYLDQNAVYNASQAPTNGLAPNDNYQYTTTLGAKFNLYRNFQLGAKAFYTGNYFTQSLTTGSGTALVPQSSVGGLVSVGLTY